VCVFACVCVCGCECGCGWVWRFTRTAGRIKIIAVFFLCMWDSQAREKHYIVKEWTAREDFIPSKHGVTDAHIPNPRKMILPPPHINLGLMKNSVKFVDKSGEVFLYWSRKLPSLSSSKVKRGIFVGP